MSATVLLQRCLLLCKVFPHHEDFVNIGISISYHLHLRCISTSAMTYLFHSGQKSYMTNGSKKKQDAKKNMACSTLNMSRWIKLINCKYKRTQQHKLS